MHPIFTKFSIFNFFLEMIKKKIKEELKTLLAQNVKYNFGTLRIDKEIRILEAFNELRNAILKIF